MDVSIVVDNIPVYAEAALLTLKIAVLGIIAALAIGLFGAVVKYFRIPVLRQIVQAYIEVSRNTPLLVQLFFPYFGLPKLGVVLSSETCAVIGLAFLGGGYMAEAIRIGLEAVEGIQLRSSLSLGLTRLQAMRHVIVPQATAIALPAVAANMIFLVKETSVVGVVAVPELVFTAKEQIGQAYETQETLLLLVVFYLLLLLPLSLIAGYAERKVRARVFGPPRTS
ncbi:amino acid ABC transporter permease [Corynebacterium sanguinis]|uniref:amino acid ABC transporter permease n=1 Tax=Corynebacterium sanguinis TaxID=2594913 RepID=UPI00223B0CF3|nr:amino acid ABC transporter permease [Corynebacterium sanguinis]MCT1424976.1 amino acid ABC transporter permease [Corynebacterium sanguinis]MCT1596860.1 amino acid ABC transporter permease [Corynebacterium sanguinis]MCT1627984.1 amino acid ABC transporter permease [Corynebacterium sanguinis]MCT1694867.1 amino acid ABC transporter permease [Corynebacterium sanguinis]MCT1714332.1 amino acid ABC transporter permease [Corynebacterium sanguinis]